MTVKELTGGARVAFGCLGSIVGSILGAAIAFNPHWWLFRHPPDGGADVSGVGDMAMFFVNLIVFAGCGAVVGATFGVWGTRPPNPRRKRD
jgi:hypothetical protein